jgi:hypothetical protein
MLLQARASPAMKIISVEDQRGTHFIIAVIYPEAGRRFQVIGYCNLTSKSKV